MTPATYVAALLGLLMLLIIEGPVSSQEYPPLAFKLATARAGWVPRGLPFSTTVYINSGSKVIPVPLIAGGAQAPSAIDDQFGTSPTEYLRDVWRAEDSPGTSWQIQNTAGAPWTPRFGGGLINVVLNPANPTMGLQILVLIGGQDSSGPRNDVWSSIDIGASWQPLNSSLEIAFSPRQNFGLTIARGFDNSSTIYAYLIGGYGNTNDPDNPVGPLNDVYYTKGMGTMPWLPLTVSVPWTPRWAFGIATNADRGAIFIAGGYTDLGVTNEVWALLLFNNNKPIWTSLTALPIASFYSSLIQVSSSRNMATYEFSGWDRVTAYNNGHRQHTITHTSPPPLIPS